MSENLADIAATIAGFGTGWSDTVVQTTRALYRPLVLRQPRDGIAVTADIPYGEHARQRLDVYRSAGRGRPVVLFIPGGGFVGGDKNADGAFYGNLGVYFAGHGFLTVVANYRLAPAAPWPAGAQDVGAAVAWTLDNAAVHGGDPRRLFLFGQSAGATHVATYLFDPQFAARPVTAAILMSGLYDFRQPQTLDLPSVAAGVAAYVGTDDSQYAARSPILHVANSRVPLFMSVAEYDPPSLAAPTFALAAAITRRDGKVPSFAVMAGHNHISTVQSLGSGQDDVGARLRAYIASFTDT